MSQRNVATIRPGTHQGFEVYVAGRYWTSFPSYNAAAEACNVRGYLVL